MQRKRGSLPHTPWFLLGSLCLGTSLLIFCDGSALRPFGRWARAMGTGRFECAPEKLLVAQRQFACVWSSLLSSLFFRILDPDVFSGLRRFFRNPAEKFAGLRSGTFFRPKEDPGISEWIQLISLISFTSYLVLISCFEIIHLASFNLNNFSQWATVSNRECVFTKWPVKTFFCHT